MDVLLSCGGGKMIALAVFFVTTIVHCDHFLLIRKKYLLHWGTFFKSEQKPDEFVILSA